MKKLPFLLVLFCLCFPQIPVALPLVSDLSERSVEVSVDFAGRDLLLYGSIEASPDEGKIDIIAIVEGPRGDFLLTKKRHFGPLWIDGSRYTINDMPAFFAVYTSAPREEILPAVEFELLMVRPGEEMNFLERGALFRLMKARDWAAEGEGSVEISHNQLFRTRIALPKTVPTGSYKATLHLVQNRRVIASQTIPFGVRKVGLGARISFYARQYPWYYGLAMVLFAVAVGFLPQIRVFK